MDDVLKKASAIGIIPVIAIEDADLAVPLARALTAGGIPATEITFRTAAGEEAIRQIARACPEVLLGAGTVLSVDQCDRAIAAGARFIVSPGYNEELVAHCLARGVTVLPGCVNASDMTRAVNAGLDTVKFFPAEQSGGIGFLKALAPVFPQLRFVPTGGVNTKNVVEYLSFDRVAACGGTWMVKKDLIAAQAWEEISRICREAVKAMLGFELAHVGIHCGDEETARRTAQAFCGLFGMDCRPGNSSVFAGTSVECVKSARPDIVGHIAIGTNSVDRAVFHLERRGVRFDGATCKSDQKGRTKSIYLQERFGGFAVHLIQK